MYDSAYEDDSVVEMIEHNNQLSEWRIYLLLLFISLAIWEMLAYIINIDLI